MGLWQRAQEGRDGGAVDVVSAAFALRLQNIAFALFFVEREVAGGEAGGRIVERVDVGERGIERGTGRGAGNEFGKDGGRGGVGGSGEDLLDFLGAGELRQDRWTLDGVRTLDLQARFPCRGVRIIGRSVGGTEIDDGYFVRLRGRVRLAVEELAARGGGDGCVCQDFGEGETEDRDRI